MRFFVFSKGTRKKGYKGYKTDFSLRVADFSLRIADFSLRIADFSLRAKFFFPHGKAIFRGSFFTRVYKSL